MISRCDTGADVVPVPDIIAASGLGSPGVPLAQVQAHDPKGHTQLGTSAHAPNVSPWA
ncbi:MAG: hypothetical protein R8K22_02590 [Mariprofundaceae bacterium]